MSVLGRVKETLLGSASRTALQAFDPATPVCQWGDVALTLQTIRTGIAILGSSWNLFQNVR